MPIYFPNSFDGGLGRKRSSNLIVKDLAAPQVSCYITLSNIDVGNLRHAETLIVVNDELQALYYKCTAKLAEKSILKSVNIWYSCSKSKCLSV